MWLIPPEHIGADVDIPAIAFYCSGNHLAIVEDDRAGVEGDVARIAGAALHGSGDLTVHQLHDLADSAHRPYVHCAPTSMPMTKRKWQSALTWESMEEFVKLLGALAR